MRRWAAVLLAAGCVPSAVAPSGTGGEVAGTSGSAGTDGSAGGQVAGTGGPVAGTGGQVAGTGGQVAGTGGQVAGTGGSGGGSSGGSPVPPQGLGPWTGHDRVSPSPSPPGGLAPNQVPMFVTVGFDDNGYSGLEGSNGTGGITWAADFFRPLVNPAGSGNAATYDGQPARATFYLTATYGAMWISESNTFVKRAWHTLMTDGHELGDHTLSHLHGADWDEAMWTTEIQACIDVLVKPFDPMEMNVSPDTSKGIGMARADFFGFRTPFLEYNGNVFTVLSKLGFRYDGSIEDGYQTDQDGTNYFWPYTLDNGSPGHDVIVSWGDGSKKPIGKYPGLWEFPANPFIVPPDSECPKYGVPAGLRAKMKAAQSWFDAGSGKITGLDYNLWVQFKMTKAEFLATLKYTLDQRLRGNRAPFAIGAHSDIYSSKYTYAENATVAERQAAMEELIEYAFSKPEVRIVPVKKILDWIRNPVPLR
jgi:hypothetical protein